MTIPTITDDLLAEIESAAKAATPGQWEMETLRTSCGVCHKVGPFPAKSHNPNGEARHACLYADFPSARDPADVEIESNAKHISLCNPANVLALIAELHDLKRWKVEQLEVMGPVLDYAQGLKIAKLGHSVTQALIDDHKRLRELEKDAARYRWLREYENDCFMLNTLQVASMEDLDVAIDAAMKGDL